jgi:hypothetical protein
MENKYVLILLILILCTTVSAKDYPIASFKQCYGDMTVRVESKTNYSFEVKPCGLSTMIGKCPCVKNTTYYLSLPDNATGNFGILINYYIGKTHNDLNKRILSRVINVEVQPKEPEPFNPMPIVLITGFIILILGLAGFGVYAFIKKIRSDDD